MTNWGLALFLFLDVTVMGLPSVQDSGMHYLVKTCLAFVAPDPQHLAEQPEGSQNSLLQTLTLLET